MTQIANPFAINNPMQNYQPSFDFGLQNPYTAPSNGGFQNPLSTSMNPMQLNNTYQQTPLSFSTGVPTDTAGNTWSWFGNQNQAGVLPTAIQGIGALAQGWLGFQQLNLAKDSLAFQKDAFSKNFENQRQLTNQQLMDRQRARYAANPNAYASPDAAWQGSNLIKG